MGEILSSEPINETLLVEHLLERKKLPQKFNRKCVERLKRTKYEIIEDHHVECIKKVRSTLFPLNL